MNKYHRRQVAMRRDWRWQQARTRGGKRGGASGLSFLLVALFAPALIGIAVGIVIVQHTGQGVPARAAPRATAALSGQGTTPAPATPQIRTGVFTLSEGGQVPVPANVLKPVNSARVVLNGEVYSVYAGSLARQPEVGVLAVLRENLQSGAQSLHLYQAPLHRGALTIQSLSQNLLTFTAADGSRGRFDLLTDQFQSRAG